MKKIAVGLVETVKVIGKKVSMGKKAKKTRMIYCRRCGKRTYHVRKKKCSSCGYGKTKRLRSYNWQKKK